MSDLFQIIIRIRVYFFGICCVSTLLSATPSYSRSFSEVRLAERVVLRYSPPALLWINHEASFHLQSSTLRMYLRDCGHNDVPVKVVYRAERNIDNYSGYFIVDPINMEFVDIRVLKFRFNGSTQFDFFEVDKSYADCFHGIHQITSSSGPYYVAPSRRIRAGLALQRDSSFSHSTSVNFDQVVSDALIKGSDSSYSFRDIVRTPLPILQEADWPRVCSGTELNSYFQSMVLGRSISCGVTNTLATIKRLDLKKGEYVRFKGRVNSGAILVNITRIDGTLVKVYLFNRGAYSSTFRPALTGSYSVTLVANTTVYNYPLLDFRVSVERSVDLPISEAR